MRYLPRSLFSQIALATFLGLLLVQLAGLWLMLDDRGRLNYKLLAEYAAQRMAGYAMIMDKASASERPALLAALSVQPVMLTLSLPWKRDDVDRSPDALGFANEARKHMTKPLEVQMLSLERLDPRLFALHPPPPEVREHRNRSEGKSRERLFARTYVAQVRLSDGSVLSFHHLLPMSEAGLSYRLTALLALLGVFSTALSVWAVRRITRPLVRFAHAAEGLARNLDQPPMSESGPTEVRQTMRAFNAMQASLKRIMETRAQALSAVSHDLRLPITRLRLRLEGELNTGARERMLRDLDEMDAMIGHTLDYLRAGSDSEPLAQVNLDALLDSVVEDMQELGVPVCRSGRISRPLKARPHALRRCLANLLDNARVYGGGQVGVSLVEHPDNIEIRVSDNGPGIPAQSLEKVFEPYFRLDASRARHTGGTGLGLPIARAIAQAHGGSLHLASGAGQGVTAILILPHRENG